MAETVKVFGCVDRWSFVPNNIACRSSKSAKSRREETDQKLERNSRKIVTYFLTMPAEPSC